MSDRHVRRLRRRLAVARRTLEARRQAGATADQLVDVLEAVTSLEDALAVALAER